MGEVMWVEVLGRHREVTWRQRLDGAPLSIGRAYDNGMVLEDPTVAAHHVLISQDETGAWFAEDSGSVNGLYAEGNDARQARVALTGTNEVLRIGRTHLRFRAASFPVAPERAIGAPTRQWPVIGAIALIACVLMLVNTWLAQTTKPELSHFIAPVAAVAFALLVWAGFWSLLTRLFSGQARFERHLLVALAGLLASLALEKFWSLAAFSLAIPTTTMTASVIGWALISAVVYAHLRVVGPGRQRLKAVSVAVLAVAAVGLQWLAVREMEKSTGYSLEAATLLPPSLRLVGGKDEESFFRTAGALRAKLDKARAEDPGGDPDS